MSRNRLAAVVALILSVAWICLYVFVALLDDPFQPSLVSPATLDILAMIVFPVVLIWIAAASIAASVQTDDRLWALESEVRNLRAVLTSSSRLRTRTAEDEETSDVHPGLHAEDGGEPGEGLDEDPAGGDPDSADEPQAAPGEVEEEAGEPPEEEAVSNSTLVRALNFAEDENDVMGIAAVDTASRMPEVAELLDLSMQMLVQLVNAGISVDHMQTHVAAPEDWRQGPASGRGIRVAELSELIDSAYQKPVNALLADQPDFAEAARQFRSSATGFLESFVQQADDDEIRGMLNTRTYRALLLIEHSMA